MFENASVMVLLQDNEKLEVCKIETNGKAQAAICQSYAEASGWMLKGTEHISFDGKYSPDADETLCIDQFALDEIIKDAVETPAGLDSFVPDDTNSDKIKAVFVGEICEGRMVIAFQKFKKEQYISLKGINLFLTETPLCWRNVSESLSQMRWIVYMKMADCCLSHSLWQGKYLA